MLASAHSSPSALTPISRRARWVAIVPLLAAAALLIGLIGQWVSQDIRTTMISTSLGMLGNDMAADAASFPNVLWPMVLRSVPVLVFVVTMLVLFHLFRRLAQGTVLDARNAQLVSRSGLGFVVFAATAVVSNTLSTLLLSLHNPPGEQILTIGFTTSDIGALAAGFALWGLGSVLGEAARVAEDNASIV